LKYKEREISKTIKSLYEINQSVEGIKVDLLDERDTILEAIVLKCREYCLNKYIRLSDPPRSVRHLNLLENNIFNL
jgi:hypothetical protein